MRLQSETKPISVWQILYFFLVVFSLVRCQPEVKKNGGSSEQSGKLFIIGGGRRGDELVNRMITEAGLDTAGYAVILPMASSEPDSAIFYARKQFTEQAIKNVVGMHFPDQKAITPQKMDSLTNASLIYISGGDQRRFMDKVYDNAIEKAIRDAYQSGTVIAGTSAGAAVMSRLMITGDQRKHPRYESTFSALLHENIIIDKGLALLDSQIIIDQHFIQRSRYNRLITAIIEYPDHVGIGIDESTAILVENYSAEVVGEAQVVKIFNPQQQQNIKNGLLGAENLNLSIFLPGDKFKLY